MKGPSDSIFFGIGRVFSIGRGEEGSSSCFRLVGLLIFGDWWREERLREGEIEIEREEDEGYIKHC